MERFRGQQRSVDCLITLDLDCFGFTAHIETCTQSSPDNIHPLLLNQSAYIQIGS